MPYGKQHEPKWTKNYFTYDVTHKKPAPPNHEFFSFIFFLYIKIIFFKLNIFGLK